MGKINSIEICRLKKEQDLNDIAKEYANYYKNSVLEEKWDEKSTIQLFKYFLDKNSDLFFVAYDDDKPVGVIMSLLKPWWDGNHLEDCEIFVCKEYRRRGVAKSLFRTLFEYAIKQYNVVILEAHAYKNENGFPYSWYKKLGFETIDDLKIISGNIKKIIKDL